MPDNSKHIIQNGRNYKLCTSKTSEKLTCPDKDIIVQANKDETVTISLIGRHKISNN